MLSALERITKEATTMQPDGEPNLDKMAQRVQNLFKCKHFYNQMDFNP